MFRAGITLAIFVALSAWVGAQGPAPAPRLSAADHLRLLRVNRVLLADLVNNGVRMTAKDDPLHRAAVCADSMRALGLAMQRAADGQDPDRVAELAGHLEAIVRDGLVPNLDDATQIIPPGSARAGELKQLRERATRELDEFRAAVPSNGKVGDDARVRDVRGKLDGLREKLK